VLLKACKTLNLRARKELSKQTALELAEICIFRAQHLDLLVEAEYCIRRKAMHNPPRFQHCVYPSRVGVRDLACHLIYSLNVATSVPHSCDMKLYFLNRVLSGPQKLFCTVCLPMLSFIPHESILPSNQFLKVVN